MGLAYPLLALGNLLAGGFLIAAVFGFSDETATELGFGVSIAVAVFGLAMVWVGREEGEAAGITALGLATAILAGWTIIATSVYDPSTAQWLVLSSACGHVILSVAGIVGDLVARETAVQAATRRPATRRRSSSSRARSGSGSRSGSRSKGGSGSRSSGGSRSRSSGSRGRGR